jgi:hypothetical protein
MSNFRRNLSLAGFGLVLVAGTASAQLGAKGGGAPLAAGSTAAEADLGASQGSLLRFGEANKAWVISANVGIGNTSVKPGGGAPSVSNSTMDIGVGFGRRSYSGAGRFRPFTEFGGSLGFTDTGNESGFDVGPYFKLGGQYFVAERLAVGASSNVSLVYSSLKQDNGGPKTTGFQLAGSLINVHAAFFF